MRSKTIPVQNIARLMTAADALIHRAYGVPGIGLVEGEPGLGKTTSVAWLINRVDGLYVRALATWTPAAMLSALLREVSRLPRGGCSAMMQDLLTVFTHQPRPIFMDEADYLIDSKKMTETLRDLHDMTGAPIVLIGMDGIGKKLAHREQLTSRVMQKVRFEPCDLEDTQKLADGLCEVKVRPDLVQQIHARTLGSARRIVVMLAAIEEAGRAKKLLEVGAADFKITDAVPGAR